MADSDITKLIHKLKSKNVQEVSEARAELAKIGKPAIFGLIGEIKTKDIPNNEIMGTLAEMSEEPAMEGYKFIMSLQEFMPADVLTETRSRVQAYGIEPDSLIMKEKEIKCVESIEIEIDPTYDHCYINLEHTSRDSGCYWLIVDIGLYVGKKKIRGYNVKNATKEALEAVFAELKAAGLSKATKSTAREWEYWTIMR